MLMSVITNGERYVGSLDCESQAAKPQADESLNERMRKPDYGAGEVGTHIRSRCNL